MKAVILCGGQGTRIRDVSDLIPKPMLPINGMPILWHIMKYYSSFGINDFILCLGYKSWIIKEFFLNYRAMVNDFTICPCQDGAIEFHHETEEKSWRVTLAETGEPTYTGGRLWRVKKYLAGEDHFCLTYGDAVSNVDLAALIERHKKSALAATLTGVNVSGRFGELTIHDDKITHFAEKPDVTSGKVNGGYMVFDNRKVWPYLNGRDDQWLEREPFHKMVDEGQFGVFKHEGFWQCMDTPSELGLLNELWKSGKAPWKTWA